MCAAPVKKKGQASKYRCLHFLADHPLQQFHHIKVLPEGDRHVPNFVGGMLSCRNKDDREYYCLAMLAFFQPW